MADIPGWLRNFHTRIPVDTNTPSAERVDFFDDTNDNEEETQRPRSRISSYFNIGRQKSPSISSFNLPSRVTLADETWHNPDDTQVVETLKVLLMTLAVSEPVPIQYNSCILQVLEAYGNMHDTVIKQKEKIQTLQIQKVKDVNEFEKKVISWHAKEIRYKQEIKSLEVMLATGDRGLELVTMARSKSTWHKQIELPSLDGIEHSDDNFISTQRNNGRMTVDFATQIDQQKSKMFNPRLTAISKWHRDMMISHDQVHQSKSSYESSLGQQQHMKEPMPKARKLQKHNSGSHRKGFQAFEQNCKLQCTSVTIEDSSNSSASPDTVEESARTVIVDERARREFYDSKPLPEIPLVESTTDDARTTIEKNPKSWQYGNRLVYADIQQHGFSFVPGDDYGILPVDSDTTKTAYYNLGTYSSTANRTSKNPRSSDSEKYPTITRAKELLRSETSTPSAPYSSENESRAAKESQRSQTRPYSQSIITTTSKNNQGGTTARAIRGNSELDDLSVDCFSS